MLAIKTNHYFFMTLLVLCFVTLVSSQGQNSFLDPNISEAFWNSPQFQRQFLASYGVRSNVEPRFENPEEQIFYSQLGDTIRDNPQQAIEKITQQLNASSSAILSYTLGSLHFQEGQHQEAIKHYEVALSQFPDYLRAHKNLGIALIREERSRPSTWEGPMGPFMACSAMHTLIWKSMPPPVWPIKTLPCSMLRIHCGNWVSLNVRLPQSDIRKQSAFWMVCSANSPTTQPSGHSRVMSTCKWKKQTKRPSTLRFCASQVKPLSSTSCSLVTSICSVNPSTWP